VTPKNWGIEPHTLTNRPVTPTFSRVLGVSLVRDVGGSQGSYADLGWFLICNKDRHACKHKRRRNKKKQKQNRHAGAGAHKGPVVLEGCRDEHCTMRAMFYRIHACTPGDLYVYVCDQDWVCNQQCTCCVPSCVFVLSAHTVACYRWPKLCKQHTGLCPVHEEQWCRKHELVKLARV
jgi:hypothetical protein